MRHFASTALLAIVSCTADIEPMSDSEADTTGDVATSTTTSSTSTTEPVTSSSSGMQPDDTTGVVDPESSSSEDSGGFIGFPDVGEVLPGFCVGVTPVGWLDVAHARDEDPIDPVCSPTPEGCGGDIVGTWTVAAHCGIDTLPNFFERDCPGSTMTFLGSEMQGTRTFGDDLTFSLATTLTFDVQVDLDTMDCFGVECEAFGELLDAQQSDLSATCSPTETACACILTISDEDAQEGTYAIEDDGLVLTIDGTSADPVPFCVDGDRLDVWHELSESRAYPETPCADPSDCEDAHGDAHEQWICVD
jgi:hypothetical protein